MFELTCLQNGGKLRIDLSFQELLTLVCALEWSAEYLFSKERLSGAKPHTDLAQKIDRAYKKA